MNDLEQAGLILADRRDGRTTSYRLNWLALSNLCPTVTSPKTELVTHGHRTSDPGSKTSDPGSKTSDPGSPKAVEADLSGSTVARKFDDFWELYPARNGRKLERSKAEQQFSRIKPVDIPAVMRAVRIYAADGQIPKDAFRWLRDDCWREWLGNSLEPANGRPRPEHRGSARRRQHEVSR